MFDCMTTQPFDSATRTCKQNGKRLRSALYVGAFRRSRLRQMHQQVNKRPHHLAIFVAAGKKNCDRQVYLLTVRKKRDDKTNKTLMLHLFIVTRGASSPNEPSSLGIFVLSDLSESCEPIESLAAKIAKLSSMTTALGWDRIANCQAAFAVSTSPSHQPATSGSSVLMTWGRFRKFRN